LKKKSFPASQGTGKPTKPPTGRKHSRLQTDYLKNPVGGFVGFCPGNFTLFAMFHRSGTEREEVKNTL
jgi:hypothetical protein